MRGGLLQEAAQEEMVIDDLTRAVGRGITGSYQHNWKNISAFHYILWEWVGVRGPPQQLAAKWYKEGIAIFSRSQPEEELEPDLVIKTLCSQKVQFLLKHFVLSKWLKHWFCYRNA